MTIYISVTPLLCGNTEISVGVAGSYCIFRMSRSTYRYILLKLTAHMNK